MRSHADTPRIQDLCVKLPVCWFAEAVENLMANILNCSKNKLWMKGLTLFSGNNESPPR